MKNKALIVTILVAVALLCGVLLYLFGGNANAELANAEAEWRFREKLRQDAVDPTIPFTQEERRSLIRDAEEAWKAYRDLHMKVKGSVPKRE